MAIEIDVVLDTNILLRSTFDQTLSPSDESRAVLELRRRGFSMGTTVSNMAEFANVATRAAAANGLGLSIAEAQRRIKTFEKHLVVYSGSLQSYDLWKELVTLYKVQGKSVHDARIVAIMLHSHIPAILTRNSSDFERFPEITVLHPDQLLGQRRINLVPPSNPAHPSQERAHGHQNRCYRRKSVRMRSKTPAGPRRRRV